MRNAAHLQTRSPAAGFANLSWIDGCAALLAGGLVLALLDPLTHWYALPRQVLTFIAGVNLGYSSLGFALSLLPRSASSARRGLLFVLIVANCFWVLMCIGLTLRFGAEASVLGLAHLIGEGIFVATLAALEWRYRRLIAP